MKNADYWRGRFGILEDAAHNDSVQYIQTLEREFKTASQSIQADIERWYGRFAANNGITLVEAKKWLTAGQLDEFQWTVQEYIKAGESLDPKWLKQLENASARVHISRLEALQLQAQQQIELLYGNHADDLDAFLRKIYSNGYYHTAFEIQRGLNVGWDLHSLNAKQLQTVLSRPWTTDNRTFRDRCWLDKTQLVHTVQTQLTQGIIRGDSPDKATKAIAEQFRVSKNKAGRLVMTETAYFSAQSQKDCFNSLDVEKYEVVVTLDELTCEVCGPLDGMVFSMADYEPGVTANPFHPWCRCCTAPHFDDNPGERAARNADGEVYYVPANVKFADWKTAFVDGGAKDGLTVISKPDKMKLSVNRNNDFFKAYGENHYTAMHDLLEEAPEKERAIWEQFEDRLKVKSATSKRHPCYRPGDGIELDVERDAKGSSWSAKYQTSFHEFGHNIDYIANRDYGTGSAYTPFSFTYKNNAFGQSLRKELDDRITSMAKSMKAEFQAHINDIQWLHDHHYISDWDLSWWKTQGTIYTKPKFSKSYAYSALEREVRALPTMTRADLSDILEGASNGRITCGFGHGKAYWKRETALSTEAFAEMFDSTITSPEQLEAIKTYFPESYQVFQEMLDELLKGGSK